MSCAWKCFGRVRAASGLNAGLCMLCAAAEICSAAELWHWWLWPVNTVAHIGFITSHVMWNTFTVSLFIYFVKRLLAKLLYCSFWVFLWLQNCFDKMLQNIFLHLQNKIQFNHLGKKETFRLPWNDIITLCMWLAEALSILLHFVALLQTLVNKSAPTSHPPTPRSLSSSLCCVLGRTYLHADCFD